MGKKISYMVMIGLCVTMGHLSIGQLQDAYQKEPIEVFIGLLLILSILNIGCWYALSINAGLEDKTTDSHPEHTMD